MPSLSKSAGIRLSPPSWPSSPQAAATSSKPPRPSLRNAFIGSHGCQEELTRSSSPSPSKSSMMPPPQLSTASTPSCGAMFCQRGKSASDDSAPAGGRKRSGTESGQVPISIRARFSIQRAWRSSGRSSR